MSTIWKNGKYQPLVKYVTLKDLKKLSTAIDIINGDSDTKGSIKNAIKDLVGEAPEAYDTLKEIADKLKSDDDLHKALNDAIILKASSDALNAEINRATSAETANKSAIDGEVTRAKSIEKSLQDQITQLGTSSSDNACKVIDVTVDGVSVVTNKIANINLSSKAETSALSTEISARESADTTITTNLNNEITRASSEEQKLKKLISDLDTTKNLQIETSTADNTTTYSFKQNNRVLQSIKVVNPVVKNNTLYL